MHKAYLVESLSNSFAQEYLSQGEKLFESNRNDIILDLESYTGRDGNLDANALTTEWFPKVKADIFISHSHLDHDLALRLVGWLKNKFGLKAFVDSLVWNSADALLKQIDDRYCKNAYQKTYNYNKRNLSTSHVHMMLAMSIAHMIDSCECIFFLSTPSSVCPQKTIEDKDQTSSPWIFTEFVLSSLIRKKSLPPDRSKRTAVVEGSESFSKDSINIGYSLDLSHLTRIGEETLRLWQNNFNRGSKYPLDALYHLNNANRIW